ncbi:MAG: DUF4350 domain-containing protein [Armatimonadota bacterium]
MKWKVARTILGVVFVLIVMAVIFALNRLPESYYSHSSNSDSAVGTSVAYYSLKRLGFHVVRGHEPFKNYVSDGIVLLLHPQREYTDTEKNKLRKWLTDGHWVVTNHGSLDVNPASFEPGSPVSKQKKLKVLPVEIGKHPIMSRVNIKNIKLPLRLIEPLIPLNPGQKLVQIDGMTKPAVLLQTVGKGGIVYVPFELFTNARVAREGDDVLLVNLARLGGGKVVFDEYQPKTSETNWGLIGVFKGSSSVSLLVWFVAFLLVIWALGTRFGPPQQLPRIERYRGEQLDAIAGPLMKVQAYSTVAHILARQFLFRMGTVIGVPKSMDPLTLAETLQNHKRVTAEARLAVIDAATCLRGGSIDTRRLLEMARKWNDTLREINR